MVTGAQLRPGRQAGDAVLSGNLLAVGSMLVWAVGFPAVEALLDRWDPLALVAGRFVMALLLLGPLLLLLEGVPRAMPWGRAALFGAVGLAGGSVLLILAQRATDPVTVAVIASIAPVAAALVEWAEERRRLSGFFLLGLGASVTGGVVAAAGSPATGGDLILGGLLAAGSCLVFSWGSYHTVRSLPGQSALAQGVATMLGGLLAAVMAWGFAAAGGWATPWPAGGMEGRDLALLAIYGLGGLAASQLLFILAIRRIGVALASLHINGAPFYVMLVMLALGGTWSWPQAAGAAIVALGVAVAQRR
ncbi:DMT family transporter [Rubellimicrobium sp. CFH 75288]|uniref:DMT family transporter n=1 Tax=Rubellimicrobium sp. CFH 75288 TaxID=2697034 RepID=UPI0014127242|nr:DMT family transporter [Rubellimicrobium sp. CFH 75288]NAZ36761.1 EamA family transporter [Rubellimicrobium sp. CFH 75288]